MWHTTTLQPTVSHQHLVLDPSLPTCCLEANSNTNERKLISSIGNSPSIGKVPTQGTGWKTANSVTTTTLQVLLVPRTTGAHNYVINAQTNWRNRRNGCSITSSIYYYMNFRTAEVQTVTSKSSIPLTSDTDAPTSSHVPYSGPDHLRRRVSARSLPR